MIAAARPLRLTTGRLTTGRLTTGRLTTGRLTTGRLTTGRLTTGRLTTGRLSTGLLAAVLLATGCDDTARAPIVDLELDLAPCLGQAPGRGDGIDRPTRCRASLDATVGRGDVNACLLAREATPGAPTRALPMQWHAGRLRPAIDDPLLDLPPGRPLDLALFLLTAADDTGTPCATLSIEQPCASDPRCVLKLTEDDVLPGAEPVRFTDPNGACAAEPGAPLAALEACNATDDDCDGKPDEGITCHPCPPEGCPACAVPDDCRDSPDQPICAASEGDPRCRPCREAAECAALDRGLEGCVDGRCTPCDVTRRDACDATPGCADGTCRCIAGECEPCDPTDCACAGGAERPECLGPGAPCDSDRQCTGGLCLDDDGSFYCSRPCALDRDDCDPGFICVRVDERPVCVAQAPACTADDDCLGDTACMLARNLPGAELACRPERREGQPVGAPCRPEADECATGHCIDRIHRCGRRCRSDDVCEAEDMACVQLNRVGWCVKHCTSDEDCPIRAAADDPMRQEVCLYRAATPGPGYIGVCDRPNDGARFGEPCQTGVECMHGLCISGDRLCTRPCADDSQCPGGWRCGRLRLDGDSVVGGCLPARAP